MLTATALGTAFEHRVEAELQRLGFETWADCYAPTEHGYAQIDIIALRPGQLWVVECKNWGGTLDAFNWVWYQNGIPKKVNDFTKQNYWHGIVVNDNVGIPALSYIVVNDGLQFKDNYFPTHVVHFSELERTVGSVTINRNESLRRVMDARSKFTQWTAASEDVKKKHRVRLQDKYQPPEVLPL